MLSFLMCESVKPCMQPEQAIRTPKRNQLSISYRNENAATLDHSWGMKHWRKSCGNTLPHLSLSTRQFLVTMHSWCTRDLELLDV